MMLKPWMVVTDKGIVLCMMCPDVGRIGRHGEQYYLALRTRRAKPTTKRNWMRHHRRCGFEGLM